MNQPASKFPEINFAGLDDWEPYSGGHSLLPAEGIYHLKSTALAPEMNKGNDKGMIRGNFVCQDDDVKALPLMSRIVYSGSDGKGKSMNRQFAEYMHSTGTTKEQIQALAKTQQKFSIEQMIATLLGRDCFARVEYGVYDGNLKSEITGWVSADDYRKAVESKTHRGRKVADVDVKQLAAAAATKNQATAVGAGGGQMGFAGGVNLGGPGLPALPGLAAPLAAPQFAAPGFPQAMPVAAPVAQQGFPQQFAAPQQFAQVPVATPQQFAPQAFNGQVPQGAPVPQALAAIPGL